MYFVYCVFEFFNTRVHINEHDLAGVTGRRLRPVRGVAQKTGAHLCEDFGA